MSFTSIGFICFLVATVILYYLFPKKHQWKLLLAASIVFYFLAGKWYLPYILFTIVSSYTVARLMKRNFDRERLYIEENRDVMDKDARKAYKAAEKKKRFRILIFGLVLNFGILAVLKYTGFTINNINGIIGIFSDDISLSVPKLLLPMGISFYTFQTMGYLIDVYRERTQAETNPFRLALFVSFFPQLVQGPISRHSDLSDQLFCGHSAKWDNIAPGMIRIAWGFFKKLVIADTVMIAIKSIMSSPERYSGAYVAFLILAYSAQIYADFTGGIDITIGIGEMLGIRIKENFDHPFASTSTKEYWRRWHITMGTWFQDYIFYPLSICKPMQKLSKWSRAKLGNALGKRIPVYLATIVTWFVTGLWHGASWNFIVWGLLNCFVILVSQELQPLYNKFHKRFPKLGGSYGYTLFCRTRTFLLMGLIRILDCYRDVPLTFKSVGTIFYNLSSWREFFTGGVFDLGVGVKEYIVVALAIVTVCMVSKFQRTEGVSLRHRIAERPSITFACLSVLTVVIIIFGSYGVGFDASGFIYNQF